MQTVLVCKGLPDTRSFFYVKSLPGPRSNEAGSYIVRFPNKMAMAAPATFSDFSCPQLCLKKN